MRVIQKFHLEPQTGVAFKVQAGQIVRVISPAAEQVADVIAFSGADTGEVLSSGRTMDYASSVFVGKGSLLYSNRSNVMLTIVEDTAERHDLLLSPCSPEMFRKLYGVTSHHPSCFENLAVNLQPFGIAADCILTTLNLFMYVRIDEVSGALAIETPSSKAGDYVDLRAEMPLILGVTACSAELTNNGTFKPIDVQILDR